MKNNKPIIGIENNDILHPFFYKEFIHYYKILEKNNKNLNAIVFSGLFLYLTMESYITWIIRWLLKNVNRSKNRRLIKVWENHFENNAYLNKKIQFFADVFLTKTDEPKIKKIEKLIFELGNLRNKIVHGHELSVTRWSDGREEKSKLAELLTFNKISSSFKEFINCMKLITILLEKIDIEELTSGITKEQMIKYLTFQ